MDDMIRNTHKAFYLIPFIVLLLVSGCREKAISRDVSGRYILESCSDPETGKNSVSNKVSTVLRLKKISGDEYQVEYIGGEASGTKLNSSVRGSALRGDLGDIGVNYVFNKRLDKISYTSYGLHCVYIKLNK